ncbi:MAG: glycosyltransferase [candidate division NC10 bacterium]|nr:glycosyltransferase [candidate division NC10 bacterium]
MRGAERCLEVFCELFPRADLFTLLHIPGSVSSIIESMNVRTSFIQRLPFLQQKYRYYLPLFPAAIERFDLRGYDLILSSSHCVAKGVKRPPGALHLAYVYTPMRYIWDLHDEYVAPARMGVLSRTLLRAEAPRLQRWDLASNSRVDYFIAVSGHAAARIRRHYGREADVIYPPVDIARFYPSKKVENYYLVVSGFAPYKRIDLAIEAFNRLGRPLWIVGGGQEDRRLRRQAGPGIRFLGRLPDPEIAELLARCKALVFPGEDEFGIVPIEAMASGRPVIAYGQGGALETVVPINSATCEVRSAKCEVPSVIPRTSDLAPPTGVFFYEPTSDSLMNALRLFEEHEGVFQTERLREHSLQFDRAIFRARIESFIQGTSKEWRETHPLTERPVASC